jgi:K+-sensing histidine kinase KdpD
VIDPLAAQNPTGSRNSHRWQDVQELLKIGISVLTSINLLHVEEYKEKVQAITGKDTTDCQRFGQAQTIVMSAVPVRLQYDRKR